MPIDSKFPLENFKGLLDLEEEVKKKQKKNFGRDCKKHIDDISQKYIRPNEETFDFAMMYIPAENVYYELTVKDGDGEYLMDYALKKRVIPVSPSSLYIYLRVIVFGLRGMKIEKNAELIMKKIGQLDQEFNALKDDVDILGGHLQKASSKFETIKSKTSRFSESLHSAHLIELNPLTKDEIN